ncbi:YggS family pyridoxal phosphate-dependent enzyme [Heliobacterium gestii]|uniref:Pyridoxal phosphate homeostasis protein n=1 Tax=Heliomicrobium gestii TaxID=2699 RepID=A0A845LET0_HELGE|nr:YggS family pyridoxal phosphate-dependent enzyme [Heliomicrobium gestii]MBM7867558.1 pyridoxal phosphate enzyme (YggS family) [Heliomicrobium gestii]MZP43894.1 YggS family pyridoxal phosphate-dependent enzyme [Heliomicrobium gestii]
MGHLEENLDRVRQRIREAALRAGRRPESIRLLAVTKTVPVERIQQVVDAGVDLLGENRVQELLEKYPQVHGPVRWHMIGTLQTNKVKYIYDKVELIHSLDRLSLAQAIDHQASRFGRPIDCLVEVNVAGEETKHGVDRRDAISFIRDVMTLEGIHIRGLMTMAPYAEKPEEARPVFRDLYQLAREVEDLRLPRVDMEHLSMGMSNDFEVAVEEGATIVRIGSGLFGGRS